MLALEAALSISHLQQKNRVSISTHRFLFFASSLLLSACVSFQRCKGYFRNIHSTGEAGGAEDCV